MSRALDLSNFFLADVRVGLAMWGLGAACSNILAGWVVVLIMYATAMLEIGPRSSRKTG